MNDTLKQYYEEIEHTEHIHYQGFAYIITEVENEIKSINDGRDITEYSRDITYNEGAILCDKNHDLTWYFEMGKGLENAVMKGTKPIHPLYFLNTQDIEATCDIVGREEIYPHDMARLLELFKKILASNENHLIYNDENLKYIRRIAQILCSVGFNRDAHGVRRQDFE